VSTALPVSNLAKPTHYGLGGGLRPPTVAQVIDDQSEVSTHVESQPPTVPCVASTGPKVVVVVARASTSVDIPKLMSYSHLKCHSNVINDKKVGKTRLVDLRAMQAVEDRLPAGRRRGGTPAGSRGKRAAISPSAHLRPPEAPPTVTPHALVRFGAAVPF
jgi:hypothetical protein